MPKLSHASLSPASFRATVRDRGWRLADVAHRWGISKEHLSRLAASQDRPAHWDDAARGLPKLSRAEARRLQQDRLREASATTKPHQKPLKAPGKVGPGYSYHGALIPGAVLTVIKEMGGLAAVGDEGVVEEVQDTGAGEKYRITLPGGEDWFMEEDVMTYLVETGKTRPGYEGGDQ